MRARSARHVQSGALGSGLALAALLSTVHATEPATNEGATSPRSGSPGWLDPAWTHRMSIEVVAEMLDPVAVLEDFPLLVDGQVLGPIFSRARADGRDVVITKRDGVSILEHEVVFYDSPAESTEVWFRCDSLSTAVREFFVYYGNVDTTVTPSGVVWNDDYVGVYHFQEDPSLGTLADYSAAGAHAFSNLPIADWTSGDVADGQIGQGWLFNGTTHYINTNLLSTQDASYTVSCWLKHTTRSTDFAFQANPGYWQLASQASDVSNHSQFKDSTVDVRWLPQTIPLDEFHHYAWVFHPAEQTVSFYRDGVPSDVYFYWPPETDPESYYFGQAINPDGPPGDERVGIVGPMYHNSLDLMNGVGDEFHVTDAELSEAWIRTEVANQRAPAIFFVTGGEEVPTRRSSWSSLKRRFR